MRIGYMQILRASVDFDIHGEGGGLSRNQIPTDTEGLLSYDPEIMLLDIYP